MEKSYGSHGGILRRGFSVWCGMKALRILIVEDCRDIAEMLAILVKSAGHESQTCHTGFRAEQAMPTYRPDVVLLDISLPDMSGWELARSLRGSAVLIAVTAYHTIEDRMKSRAAGIDFHWASRSVERKS